MIISTLAYYRNNCQHNEYLKLFLLAFSLVFELMRIILHDISQSYQYRPMGVFFFFFLNMGIGPTWPSNDYFRVAAVARMRSALDFRRWWSRSDKLSLPSETERSQLKLVIYCLSTMVIVSYCMGIGCNKTCSQVHASHHSNAKQMNYHVARTM